jgi:hypothetical protein
LNGPVKISANVMVDRALFKSSVNAVSKINSQNKRASSTPVRTPDPQRKLANGLQTFSELIQ